MNKKSFYFLFLAFCLVAIPTHNANAEKALICTNLYNEVDTLFIKVEGDVPNILPTTWKDTAELIKSRNLKFAQEGGLSIQTTSLTAEEIFRGHPKAMYVKVIYSFAPKESFSRSLDNDVLSVWSETQRSPQFDKELSIVKSRQKLMFFDTLNGARPIFYSPAARGVLESIACNILSHTKGKSCTDISDFSKNKLVDTPNICVNFSN